MFLGQGNAGCCTVTLYMGEGPRGSNGACSTLHQISVTTSTTHNQIGPLWCGFPSGWAFAHSRPLWVSPTTSPVKLGVSPAAAPTPMGVFNQRLKGFISLKALFPRAGALGCVVCLIPRCSSGLSMRECGATGSATRHTACPLLRHSESGPLSLSVCKCMAAGSARGQTACPVPPTLRQSPSPVQSRSCHGNVSPLCPGCLSPPLLPVWMKVYFFYLLGVGLLCRLVFCQFWLCEDAQCVYICLHLGSPIKS